MDDQELNAIIADCGLDERASALLHQASAEILRLHGLIQQAERRAEGKACPWCGAWDTHNDYCPAFSAPGVVR